MTKIPQLPAYAQTFISHFIVEDGENYKFNPEFTEWVSQNRNNYRKPEDIGNVAEEMRSAKLCHKGITRSDDPCGNVTQIRFKITEMYRVLYLSFLTEDYVKALNIPCDGCKGITIEGNMFKEIFIIFEFNNK